MLRRDLVRAMLSAIVFAALLTTAVLTSAAPVMAAGRPSIQTGFPALNGVPDAASPGAVTPDAPPPARSSRSWPQPLVNPYGSPVFCDLDGDGRMEIAVGDHSRAYVFDADGNILPGWPRPTGPIDSNPAVADLDEDGSPDLAFTIRAPRLTVFNRNGITLPGFPIRLPGPNWMNVSGPVIADVDGDGHPDVGAQAQLGVYFFDRHGQPLPGWPYTWPQTQNIVWSAPAVADLDGDGSMEVVVGENCFGASHVHVIGADGRAKPGWPVGTQAIYSSPALADLDGDGDLEIIVQEGEIDFLGRRLLVFHHDGTFMEGWPQEICEDGYGSRSNPAVGDVDGDGRLEIVTATNDEMIHVYRADGTVYPGYPWLGPGYGYISSVQLADVDGDGAQELFLCYYDNGDQFVGGWRLNHTPLPGFPMLLFSGSDVAAHGSVHIADRDGDGDLDLTACGTSLSSGSLCVFEIPGSVYRPGTTRLEWPKIRRDLSCTGFYPRLIATGVPPASATAPATVRSFLAQPNPVAATGRFSIRGLPLRDGWLMAYGPDGRLVGRRRLASGRGDNLEVASLCGGTAAGVYLLQWSSGAGESRTARLVVLSR